MLFLFGLWISLLQASVHSLNVIWALEEPSGFQNNIPMVRQLAGTNIPSDIQISATSVLGTEVDSNNFITIMYALYKKENVVGNPYFFAAYHCIKSVWQVIENPVEGSEGKLASSERLFKNEVEAISALENFNPGDIGIPLSEEHKDAQVVVQRSSDSSERDGTGDVGNSGSPPPHEFQYIVRSPSPSASNNTNSETGDKGNAGNPESAIRGFLNKTNVYGTSTGEILKNGLIYFGGIYGTMFVFNLAMQLIK